MKRIGIDGGFWLCLGINLILCLGWTVPAWILLACSIFFGLPIVWPIAAFALWFVVIAAATLFLSFLVSIPTPSDTNQLTPEQQRAKDAAIREASRNMTKDRDF